MLPLLNKAAALKVTGKYFGYLENTGYMKHGMVMRFLAYQFLIDFVEYTYPFLDETDYDMIGSALGSLFTNGGCLFPYPVFCANRAVLGKDEYMGTAAVRKTEDASGYEDRSTEQGDFRTV